MRDPVQPRRARATQGSCPRSVPTAPRLRGEGAEAASSAAAWWKRQTRRSLLTSEIHTRDCKRQPAGCCQVWANYYRRDSIPAKSGFALAIRSTQANNIQSAGYLAPISITKTGRKSPITTRFPKWGLYFVSHSKLPAETNQGTVQERPASDSVLQKRKMAPATSYF